MRTVNESGQEWGPGEARESENGQEWGPGEACEKPVTGQIRVQFLLWGREMFVFQEEGGIMSVMWSFPLLNRLINENEVKQWRDQAEKFRKGEGVRLN